MILSLYICECSLGFNWLINLGICVFKNILSLLIDVLFIFKDIDVFCVFCKLMSIRLKCCCLIFKLKLNVLLGLSLNGIFGCFIWFLIGVLWSNSLFFLSLLIFIVVVWVDKVNVFVICVLGMFCCCLIKFKIVCLLLFFGVCDKLFFIIFFLI